jgi:hypothetical protein
MSSRFLLGVFDSVYVVAMAAWVGSILFFSFGVVPTIFGVLGEQAGGRFVRVLFPRYYLCGAIALPAFVAGPLCFQEFRGPMVGVQAMAILAGILGMLYGGNSLTPAINAARDKGPTAQRQFDRLHRRAVGLNFVILLLGLSSLIAFAVRPSPRTTGLIELTPAEQLRYDAAVNRTITEIETKYGLRPPRPETNGDEATKVDDETVKEIESFYERKRLRDQARGKRDLRTAPPTATPLTEPKLAPKEGKSETAGAPRSGEK